MKKLCEFSEALVNAFGVENMIEYVCSLTDEQVLNIMEN